MKIYIFDEISELTRNYHSGGGLVVVAKDRNRVLELVSAHKEPIKISHEEWKNAIIYPTSNDSDERVYVFPDAGCC